MQPFMNLLTTKFDYDEFNRNFNSQIVKSWPGENMVKYTQKIVFKSSKKVVQFLTQIEENGLKIIENNIIKR